jgi:hypothetical protein
MKKVQGLISSEVKRPGREADHSHPSSAEVKANEAITLLPHTSSWGGAQLIKQRNKFAFGLKKQDLRWRTGSG